MILKRCRHSDWPRMIRLSDCPVPMADFIAESSVIMIAHTHTHTHTHTHAHAHASASAPCVMDGIFINWANEQHDGRPWHSPL